MTIPAKAKQLLTFIGSIEAPRGYNTVYGNNQDKLAKPLTSMTIGEVIAAGPTWTKRFGSSASGHYQFMRDTLRDLVKQGKASRSEIFDADCQDRLGYALLQRRGFDRFIAGKLSRTAFGLALAQEWASFPVLMKTQGAHRTVQRGQSYYAGDGLNKALVSPIRVEQALAALLGAPPLQKPSEVPDARPDPVPGPAIEDPAPVEEPKPEKLSHSKRLWTWLTTGGGTALIPFVDWRVQFLIVAAIVVIAIYAIATMPAVRKKLGLE